jgi:hypothetical protein
VTARALFLVSLFAATAHADSGLVWFAQPVRRVAVDAVRPIPPHVPAGAPEIAGPVEVGPRAAAALWLDPFELVRVRQLGGGPPRFARVVGAAGARAVLDEPGIPAAAGVWYLAQPAGRGDVWTVTAREPARVIVERVVRRRGRMIWDDAEAAVLRWIDAGADAPPPELPAAAGGGEARLRLVAEQELGARLAASGRRVAAAVPAWRKASALATLAGLRPLVDSAFTLETVELAPGDDIALAVDDPEARPWRRVESGVAATVELGGPGALRLEARPLLAAGARPVTVSVVAGGELLGRASADADPVAAPDARDPPPAFPARLPLATTGGVPVGARAEVTAPLAGRRRLELRVEGGPALVRALHARRRARMGRGGASPAALIAAARDALGDDGSPAARALRVRLARLDDAPSSGLAPPIAVDPGGALRWLLLVEEARRMAARDDQPGLRLLLGELTATPPPEVLGLLGPLLPEPTLVERLRGPRISALELAWRGRPVDPDVLAAARAAWRAGAWSLLVPDDESATGAARRPRTRGWTWLVESDRDPLEAGGSLAAVAAGGSLRATAAAAPVAGRATLLRGYLVTDAAEPGPVAVRVGEQAWSTIGLAPVERVEIAAPAGEHVVSLEGPPSARLWIEGVTGTADVRRYWPLAVDGRSVRFRVPEPRAPAPVRVALRVVDPLPGEPVKVAVRGDAGERRTLTFTPGGADARATAIDGPERVSGEASFVVWLAAGTREVWLSASGGQRVVASVAVRRHADPEAAPPPASPSTSTLERVAELSRGLAQRPEDVGALVERAGLLLDLEQPELARADLVRLAGLRLGEHAAAANRVLDRVESLDESADVGAVERPVAVAPALLAGGAELEALVPAVRAWRRLGADDARAALPAAGGRALAYLRARIDGDPLALARVALDDGGAPLLVDACTRLTAALEARGAPAGAAAALYGVAMRARDAIDHPRVRRALAVASTLGRWDAIDGTEANAGQERLEVVGRPPPSTPGAAAREALLAPPWDPASATSLDAGEGAALALDLRAPTRLWAEVHCVELRPGKTASSCRLGFAIDGRELPVRAAAGRTGAVPARLLSPGRHALAVTLDGKDPDVMASVRFLTERPLGERSPGEPAAGDAGWAVPPSRSLRFFAAAPRRPIELTVLGPATVRVELRGDPAVADLDGARLRLAGEPVERLVVLTAPGPRRIAVRAVEGRVLARFSLRQDRAAAPPPLPDPWWYDAPASPLLPWPALPAPLSTVDAVPWSGCPPSGLGTLSFELSGGSEPVGERDAPLAGFLGVGQLAVDWRRRAGDDLWLRLGLLARAREGTAAIAGLGARAYARDLPLGLRGDARLLAVTQPYAGAQAAGLTAGLRVDRSLDVGRALSLVPALSARAAWLSLDRATVVAEGDDVDPDVYNDYLRTHPIQLTARASLFWAPWTDQLGELALFAASTRSLGLDHAGAELEHRALLGDGLFASASYRPTWRAVTADRPEAFLRHDLGARLRWSLWTGDAGRVVLGADGWLIATADRARGGAALVLRYDWTGGRGLRDILPVEESFESLVERRLWEPYGTP